MSLPNPLLDHEGLPPFDTIQAEHVVSAVTTVVQKCGEMLDRCEASALPGWAAIQGPLTEIENIVHKTWSPVQHLLGVRNSDELRKAFDEALPLMVNLELRIGQSQPIYKALKALRDGKAWTSLTAAQQRIVSLQIQAAELQGVGLTGKSKDRFNEIERQLNQAATKFSNNVLDSIKSWSMVLSKKDEIDGLPQHSLQLAAQDYNRSLKGAEPKGTAETGPWRFTLDQPSYLPFMKYARRRDLREKIYRADIATASTGDFNNGPLITQILKLRREKAKLLGFESYGDLSLSRKMAGSPAEAQKLLEQLLVSSRKAGDVELAEMQTFAKSKGFTETLTDWDVHFWAERLKEEKYQFSEEELLPYFPMPQVLKGLFDLLGKIFAISVVESPTKVPVWDKEVRFFNVFDKANKHIASFYLDPFARSENKRGGAWMAECLDRRVGAAGVTQVPVAHLVCNGTPPVEGKPSLLTFTQVRTLFHEFGHGLQHMLTTTQWPQVSGIRGVEWDAVELPSQFMENWLFHKPTLLSLTSHVETKAKLPDALVQKIMASRNFRSAYLMLRQILFGLTDLQLHTTYDPDGATTVFDVYNENIKRTQSLPPRTEGRFLCAFSHIFAGGYAAGYYSYKWAEVLSADAFSAFEEAGLDDAAAVEKIGKRFRDTVLSEGGSRHPMEVFKDFRGRNPSVDALLRHSGLTA